MGCHGGYLNGATALATTAFTQTTLSVAFQNVVLSTAFSRKTTRTMTLGINAISIMTFSIATISIISETI